MSIFANPLNMLPDKFLESMAKSLTDKICETVYLDTMAGGTKPEHSRHPQREILNIITRFLQQNIDRSVPEFDNEFKRNYINAFVEQMKEPMRKMYEDDYLCLQMAETLLTEYPHVFLNVINAFAKIVQNEPKTGGAENTNTDAAKVFANKTMKLFLKYFENTNISVPSVDETIAKQREVDIEAIAKQFEKKNYKVDGLLQEKSKQAEVQKEIDTKKLQSDGDKKNAKKPYSFITEKLTGMLGGPGKTKGGGFAEMANAAKSKVEEMKQNIPKLAEESNKMMEQLKTSVPGLSSGMSELPGGLSGISGGMTKDVIEKIFESFESTKNGRDASILEYKEIKHTLYDMVIDALRFHLNAPEGRQMYLRQLEPLMRFYCSQMIANEDLATIQFFHLIKGSNKINALITQEMEKVLVSGNMVFDHKQSSNPVFENKIDEMYRGTFAYAVCENAKKKLGELITSVNPLEKIYKDLDMLKISEKIKNEKKAIDYTYTLCYDPKVKLDAPKPVTSKPTSGPVSSKGVSGHVSQANEKGAPAASGDVSQANEKGVPGDLGQLKDLASAIPGTAALQDFASKVPDAAALQNLASKVPDAAALQNLASAIPGTAALQDLASKVPGTADLQNLASKLSPTKVGGKKRNTYRKIFAQQRKTRRYSKHTK
jgi:hypothetical protein